MVDMCTLRDHETIFINIGVGHGKVYFCYMHSVGVALFGGQCVMAPSVGLIHARMQMRYDTLRNEQCKRKRMAWAKRESYLQWILPNIPISTNEAPLLFITETSSEASRFMKCPLLMCVCFADEWCRSFRGWSTDANDIDLGSVLMQMIGRGGAPTSR